MGWGGFPKEITGWGAVMKKNRGIDVGHVQQMETIRISSAQLQQGTEDTLGKLVPWTSVSWLGRKTSSWGLGSFPGTEEVS